MATITEPRKPDDEGVLSRVRKFVWLSSGMFSLAALSLAFSGYFAFGGMESAGTNFLAAVVAAGLFGLTSLLRFGPYSA